MRSSIILSLGGLVFSSFLLGCGGSGDEAASAAPGAEPINWQRYQLTQKPANSERIVMAKKRQTLGAAVTFAAGLVAESIRLSLVSQLF